jgi:hypothetical protein
MSDLEKLARAATPGPWYTVDMTGNGFETVVTADDDPVCHAHVDDAAFIAACSPDTVLSLVSALRRYGVHLRGCDMWGDVMVKCTCGLYDVLQRRGGQS